MKKILCVCAVLLMMFSSMISVSAKESDKTLEIKNETQLASFLNGEYSEQYDTFILCNHITLTAKTEHCELSGLFDGKGFSIVLENGITGLFSKVNKNAVIRNLSVKGAVGGNDAEKANGICEENNGTVENCIITASFSATSEMNGICSVNNGNIINCAVLGEPKPSENGAAVWHPATSFNNGEIARFYYIKDYVKTLENIGTAIDIEQCKNGELTDMLNAYASDNSSLVNWGGESGTYPQFIVPKGTASVFENNQAILVTCFVVSVVALLIFFIFYTDKRLKKAKSE